MATESNASEQKSQKNRVVYRNGASEAVYGLGLLGAWFYYLTTAPTFWVGVIGIFKGIFWPAFLVFEALKYFAM